MDTQYSKEGVNMYINLKIKWQYKDIYGECIHTWGFSEYTKEELLEDIKANDWFWYEEGNGACDCNRSMITGLNKRFPEKCRKDGDHWPCDDYIKFLSITPIIESIREEE